MWTCVVFGLHVGELTFGLHESWSWRAGVWVVCRRADVWVVCRRADVWATCWRADVWVVCRRADVWVVCCRADVWVVCRRADVWVVCRRADVWVVCWRADVWVACVSQSLQTHPCLAVMKVMRKSLFMNRRSEMKLITAIRVSLSQQEPGGLTWKRPRQLKN